MLDLQNKLKEALQVKKARYITPQYIQKRYGLDIYHQILQETMFLDTDSTLSERIFCIVFNIQHSPTCLHCHRPILKFEKFYNTRNEYLERFCSRSCTRSFMYDMSINPTEDDTFNKDRIVETIQTDNLNNLIYNISFMNLVKLFLKNKNIDYSRMTALEALYFIKNDRKEHPKCYCGNFVEYFGKGTYRKYCSNNCKANSKDQKALKERTCIQKYGTKNVFQNETIKNKIKDNNIKKYGVDYYSKTDEYKERIQSGDIIRKPIDYELLRGKIFDKTYDKFLQFKDKLNIIPLFNREDYVGSGYHNLYHWKCTKCGTEFEHWYYEINKLHCPKCTTNSNIEQTIIDYLTSLGLKIQVKSRSIITPFELDIYLPDKNIAIEVNGLYWHSQLNGTTRSYHLNKTKECEKQNIRLIHLFADEIMYQLPIVKARLKHILGLTKRRIMARKCVVKPVSITLKNKFLDKYHIQGADKSMIYLGLYFKTRLVAVMTFSKQRKALAMEHKDGYYELSRFAANNHFVIVGGANKLLVYFERNYQPKRIITYADRRWSQGNVYYQLGFKQDHISSPNYWYTKDYLHRIYRYNFRKNILKNKLPNFKSSLSEWENMQNNGYDRIWDCGNMVFIKNYKTVDNPENSDNIVK